jgi:hypothetical protein
VPIRISTGGFISCGPLKLRSPQSAHQEYWEHNNCALVYEYDPADDGPETIAARLIRATHTQFELDIEAI